MTTRHHRFVLAGLGWFIAITPLIGSQASAAVTEPNGDTVPDLLQLAHQPYTETTLQTYFEKAGETIDAVADANKEPGKFSPLCNFTAELVLSVSGASAGIAWYNVNDADPHAVPAATDLHHILLPSNQPTATIRAADIKADPAFVGPYVGFALTRYQDDNAKTGLFAPYYSEYQRNYLCTDCSPPDYWVAALAYRATTRSDTYYLAFEDWPMYGGTKSNWNNDGDFNDKVFKLVGISCAGGGLRCETGGIGLCGVGVSECALDGGAPTCTPLYQARDEVCDAIDNDCDGETDEGTLCPVSQKCVKGSCVFDCGGEEFQCPDGYACGTDNYCIEKSCVNITCGAGLACRNGDCISPCSGVVCPLNQTCVDGICTDICAGKICGTGSVCDPVSGACVGTCGCTACSSDKVCDPTSGRCVDPGCENKTCDVGQGCVGGACVDACTNAVCPGGATCANGTCGAPPTTGNGGATSGTGGSIDVGPSVGATPANAGTAGTSSGASSSNGTPQDPLGNGSGCGCVLGHPQSRNALALFACGGLLIATRRRRLRR
jgi:hypothetical protein